MTKPQRRGPAPSAPIGTLAARATEALAQERFKEAIDLFKLAIRQDPRPEWKASLADAYAGRARTLAAKKMFKEAAMVLENTLAPDSTLREPLLYLHCLIRDGQQQKAAAHGLLYIGRASVLPAAGQAELEALTAALLVAVPQRAPVAAPGPAGTPAAERARWLELAAASRDALAAWTNGAPLEELDRQLNRISLRSAFKPVRLLLKCLTTGPQDAERSRRLLEAIPFESPFYPFRQAVEAALPGGRGLDADGWSRLTPAQQGFVAQTRGLSAAASQSLARLSDAAHGGPGAVFTLLLKQSDLPRAEVRSACLNLLAQVPDRVAQFEKVFGPLAPLERHRLQALAAEARGDWARAERSWQEAADAVPGTDRQAGLARGVIFRHLAGLAGKHREIEGDGKDSFADPVASYLERSCEADPEHISTVLELIGRYREEDNAKDWHRLADQTVQRFPADSQVLLAATESAMARKAYKKAAGFAHRLLKLDPINPTARRRMIELQVSHARKQVRSKRPDLAAKELAAAAEWERPDAPSAPLRIARALVDLQTAPREKAETGLREAVELAGGGVGGWFRAALEAELMKFTGSDAVLLRRELARAREAPPTVAAVMAVVAALGQPEAGENRRAVVGLLAATRAWLLQAAGLDWPAAEFLALAEMLVRFEAFDPLAEYARAGRRREPANPVWRFYEIVARTSGDSDRLSHAEGMELVNMAQAAARQEDFRAATRIERFLDGTPDAPAGRRRRRPAGGDLSGGLPPDIDPDDFMEAMLEAIAGGLPQGPAGDVLEMVAELGREGAIAKMVERFRGSPLGMGLPAPMLRDLCEAVVAQAMVAGRPGPGRAGRRSLF